MISAISGSSSTEESPGAVTAHRREDGEVEVVDAPQWAAFSERLLYEAMQRSGVKIDGPVIPGAVITVGTVDPVRYVVERAAPHRREIVAKKESSDGQ